MIDFRTMEVWFATGSQHLYGDQTLKTVAVHTNEIAGELARGGRIPLAVVAKPILTTSEAITQLCAEANASSNCVGVIVWMHTDLCRRAHHTGFSQSLTMEHLQDFADMADLELLCIDGCTQLRQFRNELRWNAATYQ